ncbi:CDF family Co(II)/Ni(II) efflux transporter DmeF [Shewanella salipaludis]|uniref:CDF family Co(II)/Ni(II) efflux transporter DmeF n=1 Tax=Shewanella salipaludis TaxID=2723052 RepID=A0A972JK63_9GAMM|nr:CDF family Co(II)/Ni(II) efflux transporter DmeF [Shewanella salipaludis]NMH64027.1 CDF family Co(II)/Ni(II) efflux transporter DmeF [Shewanella salipaludis]
MKANPHSVKKWQHQHNFSTINLKGERNTRYVLYLTLITMLAEITAGTLYGSMALLADGWHMGTHAAAFMITLFTYSYAKKHADNPEFAFGTGKVSVLGGYTSAIALGLVALVMAIESCVRLVNPTQIQFDQAILVAIIGLTVNVLSVFLLKDHHSHDHGHDHGHDHSDSHGHGHSHQHDQTHAHSHGHHQDHNLRAAYFHVLADALTSVLAIAALLLGKYLGLNWLDPVMGIVGALIIGRWAWGLIRQTSPTLLDASIDEQYRQQMINTIEEVADHQVADIHIWRVSADHFAAMISIVAHQPRDIEYFKARLARFDRISHLTLEINTCQEAACHAVQGNKA